MSLVPRHTKSGEAAGGAPEIPKEAPRAPTAEAWAAMSEQERLAAVDRLIDSVSEEEIEEREAMSEGDPHLDAKVIARDTLRTYFGRIGRSLYIGADIRVLYPGEKGFTPDLIAVRDAVLRPRHCWMVSLEGKGVDLALEIHDRGSWRKDYVDNVARYAALGIREYFILDIGRQHLRGYRLPSPEARTYEPIRAELGRFASQVLELDLVIEGDSLCFYHGSARLLGFRELLQAEQARAEAEQARAEAEQARADQAIERLKTTLLGVLRLRDLAVSDAQQRRIRETGELALLERWMARAFTAAGVDEILADD